MNQDTQLNLAVLRRLMAAKKRADENLYNVSKTLLKNGVKISYQIARREYFGKVVEVIGAPTRIQVRVQNLSTLKTRDIRLEDIAGILQEV